MVVSAAEILLQPNIHADKEVTTAHFLDLELGLAELAIVPTDRGDRPTEAPHDGFERNFNGEVKMRGHERSTAVDHTAAVGFKRVGRVVEGNVENCLNEQVSRPIHEELKFGVVVNGSAFDEAAAKNALVALLQEAPVRDGVLGVVGAIRHHNHHGVTRAVIESVDDGAPEAVQAIVLHRRQSGVSGLQLLQHLPGAIGAPVVDYDNFMRDIFGRKRVGDFADGDGQ